MHGAKRILLCNVCHVPTPLFIVSSLLFLHKNLLSLAFFLHLYQNFISLNQSFLSMSYSLYSPPLSPFTSPESTPPLSPLYSIEEPKTLSEQELNAFREAALHIINTHTPEEATRIFTEGLISVDEVKPKTLPKEKKVPETGGNVKNNGNKTP